MLPMEDMRLAVAEAIRKVRTQVQWKPGKNAVHLQKRQAMGHLPIAAGTSDYNAIIRSIVHDPEGAVFEYHFRGQVYVAVRSTVAGRAWLALFSLEGLMEPAFPPDDIGDYLTQPGYTPLGTIMELLK